MKTPEAFIISLSQPEKAHRFPDLRKSSRKISDVGARRFGVSLMYAGCTMILSFSSSHVHRDPVQKERRSRVSPIRRAVRNDSDFLFEYHVQRAFLRQRGVGSMNAVSERKRFCRIKRIKREVQRPATIEETVL
jgi:hypothetical protein